MNNQEVKRMLTRLGWMAGLFVSVALVIAAIEKKEASPVESVNIYVEPLADGNMLINDRDIQITIERSFGFPLETMNVGAVDVNRLERVLEEDPFILDADAFIDAENTVKIWVTQRMPVLRIIDNNGLNYYVDKEGKKMPLSKHFSARVLVGSGNIPPHVPDFRERDKYLLNQLFKLSERLRRDDFLNAMIEQIHISNQGEFTLIPKLGDQQIYLGRFANLENKLDRLMVFYDEAIPYEGWNKYRSIDLRYDGQVVCKKR